MNAIRSRDLQPRPQPASVAALTALLISGSQSGRSVECQKWLIMSRLWLSLFIVNTSEYMNMNWFGIVIWGSFSSNLIVRLCFYFPCPDHHYNFKMNDLSTTRQSLILTGLLLLFYKTSGSRRSPYTSEQSFFESPILLSLVVNRSRRRPNLRWSIDQTRLLLEFAFLPN